MLTEFWAKHIDFGFHPEDAPRIESEFILRWTPEEALAHEWDYGSPANRSKFHENLIPVPYAGNLNRAKVFILTLNPGYITECYLEDHYDNTYQAAMHDNLAQSVELLPGLNPRLVRSGGYRYWRKALKGAIDDAAELLGTTPADGANMVARKIAVIELCPYHSVSSPGGWVFELPSAKAAMTYVQENLVPRARVGKISIIVTRSVRSWDLQAEDHILVRSKNFRSASLTPEEREEIARHWKR